MKKERLEMFRSLLISSVAAQEAAISLLEEEIGEEFDEKETCPHPKDSRKDMSTMGFDRWQCKDCGYVYEKKLKGEVEG